MKTVASTLVLLLAALSFVTPSDAAPKMPAAELIDMYALREADSVVIHILANGDISQFLSDQAKGEKSYKLTLDVPALSPIDAKYDVETPFSHGFQMWPMQLEKKYYSRIEIELDLAASSVVGLLNESHLFIRINHESLQQAPVALSAPANAFDEDSDRLPPPIQASPGVAVTPLGVLPIEPGSSDEDGGVAEEPPSEPEFVLARSAPERGEEVSGSAVDENGVNDEELFFNLFPTPAPERQTLFNVTTQDMSLEEGVRGIRVGRFALLPSVDASWMRGSNLLLQSDGPFSENAYLVRGRVTANLLDSAHRVKLTYEARYRDFENLELQERFTNLFDVETRIVTSPRSSIELQNHFVRGNFESQEFDPGGEVVASTDPFYRNFTRGVAGFDFSERLGVEMTGSYNRVEFVETSIDFFSYDTTDLGGSLLYHLSPLTSVFGEYIRRTTPEPEGRPQAESYGDLALAGIRGEITPLLRGQVRAGFANQHYDGGLQTFSGFVADVRLSRDFGEKTALTAWLGRGTNPSSYGDNGFYVSNYGRLQFVGPLMRNLRLTANVAFFGNNYALPDVDDLLRNDDIFSGSVGAAYFFTPLAFLSVDFRHDQRNSTLEQYQYSNNAVQFMVGFGFLNR